MNPLAAFALPSRSTLTTPKRGYEELQVKLDKSLFGFSVSYLLRNRNIYRLPTAIWDAKNGKPG